MNNDIILDLFFCLYAIFLIFKKCIIPIILIVIGRKIQRKYKTLSYVISLTGVVWLLYLAFTLIKFSL